MPATKKRKVKPTANTKANMIFRKCGICRKNCEIASIYCDNCDTWYHLRCEELELADYEMFRTDKNVIYSCKRCFSHDQSVHIRISIITIDRVICPYRLTMPPTVPHGYTGETFPDYFNSNARPKITTQKLGQLSDDEIKQFFEDGYVIVEKFFNRDEIDPCRDAVNELVEELAQKLYNTKRIKSLYRELGFFERLTAIEKDFPGANILLHKGDQLAQAFKDLWSNERMLNVVEQLIGPEIAGHPVWNLRTKTPQNEATTVPWHQDCGYLNVDCYKTLQPTAWIPLLDANEKNGCMQVANKGHRKGLVAPHQCCYGGTWYVMLEEKEMIKTLDVDVEKDIITCPVPYGGMLLLNNLIPHRSLPNMTKQIRWSLDLRWQRPDEPAGFYGMKEPLPMRTGKDPNFKIDWTPFDNVDRREKQREAVKDVLPLPDDPEFDTTIQGPWMKKWDIVHMNQHTSKLTEDLFSSWHGHKS